MPHIFLYGPSGTGKSTIGKILAKNLKLPFIDLDEVIEKNAGMPIPQIMTEQGELAFRDLETSALNESVGHAFSVTSSQDKVVALGGGALLREENRVCAEANGIVVLLIGEVDTLIKRLETDSNKRPLLSGDLREKLSSMLMKRSRHYASFPNQLQVDDKSVEQVAYQIQVQIGRYHLSAMGEYDVIVGNVGHALSVKNLQNSIIVTDENVAKFHLEKIKQTFGVEKSIVILAGEEHKNLETVSHLWKSFLQNGLDRKSTVIALGGGVIGDMAGFAER